MSDWEESDNAEGQVRPVKLSSKLPAVKIKRFEGEDEEGDDGPASDWEESSEEEEEEKPTAAPVAPPKKKGTIKAKIAEKEAQKAAKKAEDEQDGYDSDDVLDPRERARMDKEREITSDLHNAADLLGGTDSSSSDLDWLTTFQPRTKEDFQQLSSKLIEMVIKRHQDKPLYASFVEHHVKELAQPLKDVEVRKAASGLTTLANEKQKEQRDKASGKKKSRTGTSKPTLKAGNRFDTGVYEEALDDFGKDPEDFM